MTTDEMAGICVEKHKAIDDKLEVINVRLGAHGDRIDKIENTQVRTETVVQQLCKEIESLVITIKETNQRQQETTSHFQKVLLGASSTAIVILVGFFIWYVQNILQ